MDQINLVLKTGIALRKESAFFHILAVTIWVQVQVQKPAAVKNMNDSNVDPYVRSTWGGVYCCQISDLHYSWEPIHMDLEHKYFLMHSISLSDNKSVHIKCEYGVKTVHWSQYSHYYLADHTACKTVNVNKDSQAFEQNIQEDL